MTRRSACTAIPVLLTILLVVPVAVAQQAVPASQPKRGGVLRIAEREAPSLDPHLNVSFLTHTHVSLAYGQLVRFPTDPSRRTRLTSPSCRTSRNGGPCRRMAPSTRSN